jgi:hypothetical protein
MSDKKKRAFIPARRNPRDWAAAATKVVGSDLSRLGKRKDEVLLRMVWVGILLENCPNVSLKDVTVFGGIDSAHSTAFYLFKGWKRMLWRERHGWLMMAEAAMQSKHPYWTPSAWGREVHELAAMSLEKKVKVTAWHNPVGRIRFSSIAGGRNESV